MPKHPRPQAQPLTAHHLFLPVVALWFGALFGLGSLAVRPALLEALVIYSRIDLVVPAAAPPLGITARILVALVMAAAGSGIGILLARQLTRRRSAPSQRRRQPGEARREQPMPRSPVLEPDAETAVIREAGNLPGQRRRALAIEPEEHMFTPPEMAPLPGGSPQILDIAAVSLRAEVADGPLDLAAFPAPAPQTRAAATVQAWPEQGFSADPALPEPQPDTARSQQVFGAQTSPLPAAPAADPFSPAGSEPAKHKPAERTDPWCAAQTVALAAEPAPPPFAAPAASRTPPAGTVLAGQRAAQPAAGGADYQAFAPGGLPQPVAAVPAFAAGPDLPVAQPAADGAEIADLTSRLAASMARRRALRAAVAAGPEAPRMPAPASPPQSPPPAACALSPAAMPAAMPKAMRPLQFDELDDGGDAPDKLLPPRRNSHVEASEPRAQLSGTAAEDGAAAENGYASLLGMATPAPARAMPVRIEEPEDPEAPIEPLVIFPGQMPRLTLATPAPMESEPAPFRRFDAPASAGHGQPVAVSDSPPVDRGEADLALRQALANLQRMSGAA